MRAVDERISVEAALGIKQFVAGIPSQMAASAPMRVRTGAGVGSSSISKRVSPLGAHSCDLDRVDAGERRRRSPARLRRNVVRAAPSTSISTPSASLRTKPASIEPSREAIGEGPEANALHGATHAQPQPRCGPPARHRSGPKAERALGRAGSRSRRRTRRALRRCAPRRASSLQARVHPHGIWRDICSTSKSR